MSWETWIAFFVIDLVLCLTPGPAVLLVLSQALSHGTPSALWAALGILAGNGLYFTLSATGLGIALKASYDAFSAVRWIGAAYLAWLGITTFIGRSQPSAARAEPDTVPAARMLVNGFVLQAANPTALAFFMALLPQFVDTRADVVPQLVILGVTSVVVELVVLAGYGALAGRARAAVAHPRFAAVANRVAGVLLVGAGIGMAMLRGD